ncbi:MAG TPA: PAS domain S-box protein [Acidimicrobiales bacterium]|nr:PAS domain S-box protein [Acidimicrobiales bacterium]
MGDAIVDVVVVDDADDVRQVVGRQLHLSGRFRVVAEGATGAEAIELAARLKPGVLVMDASMPGVDGLQALAEVRRLSPSTCVVMFSGFGGPLLEQRAAELGADGWLEKSTPIAELPGRILAVLARRSGTEAVPAPAAPDEPPMVDFADAADEALLASHLERFRTVFDQAAIGMATMTRAGTVVRVNRALERIFDRPAHRLIGCSYSELAGARTSSVVAEAVADVAEDRRETSVFEHPLSTAGGERWVRATLTVVRDEGGRPLYLFAQAEDITERRRAEERLRVSEERFRLLVEGVHDYAIFMLDPEGHITTWNSGAQRMKGWSADEIIGQHFRIFYPEEARRRNHPEYELRVAVLEGRYEEEGWRLRKDGTRFWANVLITALFDKSGNVAGFSKVTRDVTERRMAMQASEEAAAELAAANIRLQATTEETAQFLAVTAHELQSPVAVMTGAADLLDQHWAKLDEADRVETLRTISRGGARLRRLLDELLTVSRLESGSFVFALEEVALAPLLHEAVSQTGLAAGDVTVLCEEELAVRADPLRVVQIVTNLLSNAAKYGSAPVVVQATSHRAHVEVLVCDAGNGVAPEHVPLLFRKFVQGPGRRGRGTGLGLFIVRELARGQGGDAWYERGPDDRPCFAFSLPVVPGSAVPS